jgi:hypothetical protein
LAGQIAQQADGFFSDDVLGIIEEDFIELKMESIESSGIRCKEVTHVRGTQFGAMSLQCTPGGQAIGCGHDQILLTAAKGCSGVLGIQTLRVRLHDFAEPFREQAGDSPGLFSVLKI